MIKNLLNKNIFFDSTLFILTSIALFFRFYRLDLNLPPLYIDESGGHYLIYQQIIRNYPNLFEFIYNKIFWGSFSFSWIFGLNPLGVRAASALYGSIGIIAIYFFVKSIGNNKHFRIVALLTALITVFSPWNFNLSRLGHSHIPILIILVCFHYYLYINATIIRQYLISLIPLYISLLYYPSSIILVFAGTIPILIEIWKQSSKKQKMTPLLLISFSIALVLGTFIFRYNGLSILSRSLDLAIWRDINVTADSNYYRGISRLSSPSLISFNLDTEIIGNKLVFNKPLSVINIFVRNYLSFFSPEFLFIKGDPVLRHSTGQTGVLLPFLSPFLLYGAYSFFHNTRPKIKNLLIIWILFSPIPAALTKDGYGYLLRSITLMPLLTFFCAFGLIETINKINNKIFKTFTIFAISIIGLFSTYYYLYGYFHVYPAHSAVSFEAGFKELSDFQKNHQDKSLIIIWDGYYPHLHFRFWQNTPFNDYFNHSPQQHHIGQNIIYQMYSNLFFSPPSGNENLINIIKALNIDYLCVPEKYSIQYSNITDQMEKNKIILSTDNKTLFSIYQLNKL